MLEKWRGNKTIPTDGTKAVHFPHRHDDIWNIFAEYLQKKVLMHQ